MKVFIDTSIFVDCLRINPVSSSKNFLESLEGTDNGFTSSIVVAELSVGAYLSKKTELNDCLIAATALSYGIKKVVTRNINHFNKIKELNAVTPEDMDF
jgi:tRNA(fMet)-specific endonuclease VapC